MAGKTTKNFQTDGNATVDKIKSDYGLISRINKRKVSYNIPFGWYSEDQEEPGKKDEVPIKIREHKVGVASGNDNKKETSVVMDERMTKKFRPNEEEAERSSLKDDFDEVPSQMANITFPAIRNSQVNWMENIKNKML